MMLKIYLLVLAFMSLLAFVAYASDKVRAKRDRARIPEIVLLTLASLGGGAGAMLGSVLLRHKSNAKRKLHFALVTSAALLLQAALLVYFVCLHLAVL